MENLKYEPMRKGMTQKDIAQEKAIAYSNLCARRNADNAELADTIIGTIGCIAVVVGAYVLLRCGIIL